jgi:hypothetical protein
MQHNKMPETKASYRSYLLVDAAFQEMANPMTKNVTACATPVDGSLGNASSRMAPSGSADAELICARAILPVLGNRLATGLR